MPSLVRTTGPTAEPLVLADVKNHLRIEDGVTTDDILISALIAAARDWVEGELQRSLATQSWRLTLDHFPVASSVSTAQPYAAAWDRWPFRALLPLDLTVGDEIRLPMPPLVSVESVKYLDANGATQTLATSIYTVDTASTPGRITRAYAQSWPVTQAVRNAVWIDYTTGYGASGVPPAILAAMLLQIGDLYENREAHVAGSAAFVANPTADRLLAPFSVLEVA